MRWTLSKRQLRTGAVALTLLFGAQAFAIKTDFTDDHSGLSFGGGTYFPLWNKFDPVPSLAPSGTTVSGSSSGYRLPIQFGFFIENSGYSIEPYLRYAVSRGYTWTSTGTVPGTGSTSYGGLGGGVNLGVRLYHSQHFKFTAVVNAEYVDETATVSFTPTGSAAESLSLSSSSFLLGAGIESAVWLGDMWSLGIFTGYQNDFQGDWSASQAGASLSQPFSAGAALDPVNGASIPANLGGILITATLRLSFR